jgi:hypothetical protein
MVVVNVAGCAVVVVEVVVYGVVQELLFMW